MAIEESDPVQVFVRNDKGKVWGPLALQTVELLIDGGLLPGRLQVSSDGVNFAFPGRFPGIRVAFPRELWGDVIAPGEDQPLPVAALAEVAPAPDARPHPPAAAAQAPGAPMAGPGAIQAAQAPLRAGPGAMAAASGRASPRGDAARARPPTLTPPPGPAAQTPKPPPKVAASPPAPPRASPPVAPPPAAPSPAAAPADPEKASQGPAPPASGDLSKLSAVHLYYLAASGDHTGLLTLALSDRNIEIHFRKGNPEYVGSSHEEDSVAGFLLKEGLATPEQISQAEAALDRFGGELVAALFGLSILNPGTAFSHLVRRAAGLILKALVAERGRFSFEPKELPHQRVMPLGNRWAVLAEQVRRVPLGEMKRRLGAAAELPVMKSGGRVSTADLRLTPHETRLLGRIDGVRSLSQLCRDFPQEADHAVRVVFLLEELEAVSFAEVPVRPEPQPPPPPPARPVAAPDPPTAAPAPPKVTAPAPQSPKPGTSPAPRPGAPPHSAKPAAASPQAKPQPGTPTAPARPPPLARSAAAAANPPPVVAPSAAAAPAPPAPAAEANPASYEAEIKQLRATATKVTDQNYFEILGLPQSGNASAAKAAYFKLAKQYHPDTVPGDAPAELTKLKADIFARIGDAYRTLTDEKARQQYLEELKSGGGQVDVAQILAAEEMFQKGCILVKARKFPEAVAMLTDAIKANAEEGEFYAWRGYATFFTHKERSKGLAEAAKDINFCLKKNERCAQAYYFLGHMAKLCNDPAGAAKHFKRCVELQPDLVDAQRELRLMKK